MTPSPNGSPSAPAGVDRLDRLVARPPRADDRRHRPAGRSSSASPPRPAAMPLAEPAASPAPRRDPRGRRRRRPRAHRARSTRRRPPASAAAAHLQAAAPFRRSSGWLRKLWPFPPCASAQGADRVQGVRSAPPPITTVTPLIQRAIIDDFVIADSVPAGPLLALLVGAAAVRSCSHTFAVSSVVARSTCRTTCALRCSSDCSDSTASRSAPDRAARVARVPTSRWCRCSSASCPCSPVTLVMLVMSSASCSGCRRR